jgi:hypothetical protein
VRQANWGVIKSRHTCLDADAFRIGPCIQFFSVKHVPGIHSDNFKGTLHLHLRPIPIPTSHTGSSEAPNPLRFLFGETVDASLASLNSHQEQYISQPHGSKERQGLLISILLESSISATTGIGKGLSLQIIKRSQASSLHTHHRPLSEFI